MLVEDDVVSAGALAALLRYSGWEIVCTTTVADAMKQLDDGINAIVLDLMLPDGDGTIILEQVRQRGLKSKVIVTTASNDTRKLQRVLALNPEGLIQKPIDLQKLMRAL